MYTVKDIEAARELAGQLGMRGTWVFSEVSPEEAVPLCNGIGAEWMPAWCRKLLTLRFLELSVPSIIHDLEYSLGDGSRKAFDDANLDLRFNGALMANFHHAWYSPLRYVVRHDAGKVSAVCEALGWPAYKAAIRDYANRRAGMK